MSSRANIRCALGAVLISWLFPADVGAVYQAVCAWPSQYLPVPVYVYGIPSTTDLARQSFQDRGVRPETIRNMVIRACGMWRTAGTIGGCYYAGPSATPNVIANAINISAPRLLTSAPGTIALTGLQCTGTKIQIFWDRLYRQDLPGQQSNGQGTYPTTDLVGVIAHELGHALGFNDENDSLALAVMDPPGANRVPRALGYQDVNGMRFSYALRSAAINTRRRTAPSSTWTDFTFPLPQLSTNVPPSIAGKGDGYYVAAVKRASDNQIFTARGTGRSSWSSWFAHGNFTDSGVAIASHPNYWLIAWAEKSEKRRIWLRVATIGTTDWNLFSFAPFPCSASDGTGCSDYRPALAWFPAMSKWVMVWVRRRAVSGGTFAASAPTQHLMISTSPNGTSWAAPMRIGFPAGPDGLFLLESSRGPALACNLYPWNLQECVLAFAPDYSEEGRVWTARLQLYSGAFATLAWMHDGLPVPETVVVAEDPAQISPNLPTVYGSQSGEGPMYDLGLAYDNLYDRYLVTYDVFGDWDYYRRVISGPFNRTCSQTELFEPCPWPCYDCPIEQSSHHSCVLKGMSDGIGSGYNSYWFEDVVIGAGGSLACP